MHACLPAWPPHHTVPSAAALPSPPRVQVKSGMVRQRQWSTAVEGARDVTEWACFSTSFLLTGERLGAGDASWLADQLWHDCLCGAMLQCCMSCVFAQWRRRRLPPRQPAASLPLPTAAPACLPAAAAGNLLAPYVTAVTVDLLFSAYQRRRVRQVDRM